eukprot:129678_1
MSSVHQDVRNILLYGTPNAIAFIVAHSAIYGLQWYFPEQCANFTNSKDAIQRGEYYRWLTSNFMHDGFSHLMTCTIAFTPHCYRLIDCIDRHKKKRSMCMFWSLYVASGFLGCSVAHLLESSYKRYLLYYFRDNDKIMHDITTRYDAINQDNKESIGSSGAIFSLYAFNCLISLEMIIKRFHFVYKLFVDDGDGLIDITDEMYMKYDILDYDLHMDTPEGHTTKGEHADDMNEGLMDDSAHKTVQYHTIKLFVDACWMIYSGYEATSAAMDLYWLWKLAKQERGGQDIMKLQSDLYRINFIGHFSGSVAGIMVYILYKMFGSSTNDTKPKEAGETETDQQTPQ